jgi:hypothetical protein
MFNSSTMQNSCQATALSATRITATLLQCASAEAVQGDDFLVQKFNVGVKDNAESGDGDRSASI